MINIAVFASGSGTNAENILSYFKDKKDIKIALILSNKTDAYVLERAKKWNIAHKVFEGNEFKEDSKEILSLLKEKDIQFIVLSGFLLKVSDALLKAFPHKIVNIHPALLPKYGGKGMYGLHVHEAVVAAKEKESGITIHYANDKYDSGDIIFQAKTSIEPTETPEEVAAKVHKLEYAHFPHVIEETVLKECK